jgi:hypothetical protein
MHVVHSVIRRTGTGVEFIIENENYLSSRKNSKGLMKFERNKNHLIASSSRKYNDTCSSSILVILKEAEAVTARISVVVCL